MAKDDTQIVLPDQSALVSKGLFFTRKDYEWSVKTSMDLIRQAKKNRWSKEDVMALYGIFYASIAGLIRAGALMSRGNGVDGFPEIQVIAGDKQYRCRESVLYGILEEETELLLNPYEDTFASYIPAHPFRLSPVSSTFEDSFEPSREIPDIKKKAETAKQEEKALQEEYAQRERRLVASHKKEIIRLKEEEKKLNGKIQYLESQVKNIKDADGLKPLLEQSEQRRIELEHEIKDITASQAQLSAETDLLKQALSEKENELHQAQMTDDIDSQKEIIRLKEECDRLKREQEQMDTGAYYSELLPDLIKDIHSSRYDTAVRILLLLMSASGVVLSLMFLV